MLFAVHNVRQKIADPYNEIQTQCLILTRLHETSNLLSCIIQVQKLAKNVTKQDMLVASTMIKEVGWLYYIFMNVDSNHSVRY